MRSKSRDRKPEFISMHTSISVFVMFVLLIPLASAIPSSSVIVKDSGVTGGLVVHIGSDPEVTAGLLVNNRYLVQGLYRSGVESAREAISSAASYGRVSVIKWDGEALPYVDNLVNLIVVDRSVSVDKKEIMRVLAPRGVAIIDGKKVIKPVPSDIDDWTHYLHGPNNNAVANDLKVAPPYHIQWEGAPRWQRSHDTLASLSIMVSSEGRLFYIHDEGERSSIALPSKWFLVSRDAFNGIIQWKRPMKDWQTHFHGFRNGPADLSRRLVAVGGKVYVTMGLGAPISILDADTGEPLMECRGTEGAHEIIVDGEMVYAHIIKKSEEQVKAEYKAGKERVYSRVAKPKEAEDKNDKPIRRGGAAEVKYAEPKRSIVAFSTKTGKILWEKTEGANNVPLNTLTTGGGRVFYQNSGTMFCLNAKTGEGSWEVKRGKAMSYSSYASPTVVFHKDVLLWADKNPDYDKKKKLPMGAPRITGKLIAYSVKDGRELWSCPSGETFHAPFEVFVMDDVVWTGGVNSPHDRGLTEGRDYKTGEIVKTRTPDNELYQIAGHASCYRNKATERFLIMNRAGVDFLDVKDDKAYPHHFTRGTCQYGILPANGHVYQPPHACNCYIYAKLSGHVAMAGKRYTVPDNPDNVLEKGEMYGIPSTVNHKPSPSDWPTYRYDAERSSAIKGSVSSQLKKDWTLSLKGELTQPVAAGQILYVASRCAHTLYAIDVSSGRVKWSYIAGGEVDSPPAVYNGLAIFGCADGWVYCLDAGTGKLVWRFRAAHNNRQIVSYGQIQSVWPVPGNVLVLNGNAYFVAGRTSYMDGGMFLYKLDAETGKRLAVHRIYDRDPETDLEYTDIENIRALEGALPDVLSSDGASIFLRHRRFDLNLKEQPQDIPHLFSSVGFLDPDWWHRSFWQYGNISLPGYGGWGKTGNSTISGQLLSFNDTDVYGYGHRIYGNNIYYGMPRSFGHYRLFSMPKTNVETSKVMMTKKIPAAKRKEYAEIKRRGFEFGWAGRVKLLVNAMILANDKLVVAGPPDVIYDEPMEPALYDQKSILEKLEKQNDIHAGKSHGILMVVSAKDGKILSEQELRSPPVFNGMIVADGKLFITDARGGVICYK